MSAAKNISLFREVTCPFCSLLCDDLQVQNESGKLTIRNINCSKARHNFQQKEFTLCPRIKGKDSTLEKAVKRAANILHHARQPIISGLGTDTSGVRAAIKLADKTGAVVDHSHSDGVMRNTLVLQTGGWIMTTLAELKNRADLVIFLGTDGVSEYPRFFERFIWNKSSLTGLKQNSRDIYYIGQHLNTRAGKSPGGKQPVIINCKPDRIGEIVGVLRALIKGNCMQPDFLSRTDFTRLLGLAEQIKHSHYGVIVWEPAKLDFPQSELTLQMTCEFIKDLNQTTRFAGLSLGGNNGGITAINVCSWQSGYPLRVNFADGTPDYDPDKYSMDNMLAKKDADALLWISSFHSALTPPVTNIPTIVLARPSKDHNHNTDVYIPISTPGLDHTGNLFRTDSVVSLPLKQVRETSLYSTAEILERIYQEL